MAILRSNFVYIEDLEVRGKDRSTRRGAKRVQMVYFGCEFPHPRHVILDLVPYTVQRSMARNIDIKWGVP